MTQPPKPSPHHAPQREDRVAAALRENLQKRKERGRKMQQQTRADSDIYNKDK